MMDLVAWFSQAVASARECLADNITIKSTAPVHARGGYVLDIDGDRAMSQFIVWFFGATEASVFDVATEQRTYVHDATVSDVKELDGVFKDFLRAVAQVETPTS